MKRLLLALAIGAFSSAPVRAQTRVTLPTMGMTVSVPDETLWTVEVRDIGGGRMADVLTGHRNGATFWFMVIPVTGLSCQTMIDNALQRPGAWSVSAASWADAPMELPAVMNGNGVAVLCYSLGSRIAMFSLQPGQLTSDQAAATSLMVGAIRHGGGGAFTGTSLYLSRLELTVPMTSGHAWTAGIYTAPSGTQLDQVTGPSSAGNRLMATITSLDGSTCPTALATFVTSDTHIEVTSSYIPSTWFSTTVAGPNGIFACLPRGGGVLLASVVRIDNGADLAAMRGLLADVEVAARSKWGASIK